MALGRFRLYILKKKQLRISQHLSDLQRIKATEPVNEVRAPLHLFISGMSRVAHPE